MTSKTNAIRILQQAKVPFEEAFYEFDENDLNGMHAAHAIGYPPEQVFKTLVVRGARTGYIRGGCSPVGMKKRYPTHFEESCLLFDKIAVSAGERGHQMIVNPEALAALVGADYCNVI